MTRSEHVECFFSPMILVWRAFLGSYVGPRLRSQKISMKDKFQTSLLLTPRSDCKAGTRLAALDCTKTSVSYATDMHQPHLPK